jgi:hypothetical protein
MNIVSMKEGMYRKKYKEKNKRFPDWNFKENGEKWPQDIYDSVHTLLGKKATGVSSRHSEEDI